MPFIVHFIHDIMAGILPLTPARTQRVRKVLKKIGYSTDLVDQVRDEASLHDAMAPRVVLVSRRAKVQHPDGGQV